MKKALESDKSEEIRTAMDALTEAVFAATQKIYEKVQAEQQAQQQAGETTGGGTDPKKKDNDTVMDADYTVKDE